MVRRNFIIGTLFIIVKFTLAAFGHPICPSAERAAAQLVDLASVMLAIGMTRRKGTSMAAYCDAVLVRSQSRFGPHPLQRLTRCPSCPKLNVFGHATSEEVHCVPSSMRIAVISISRSCCCNLLAYG